MLSLGAFRSQAVEKIESPEQLDQRIKPAKPGTWIALVALLVAVAIALIWSLVSTVPVTVGGTGFFLPQQGWNSVQAAAAGIVSELQVNVNDPVVSGEPLALITTSGGTVVTVRSPVTGYVVEVAVSQQEYVSPGTQMAVIRPHNDTLVVHAYIPTGLAHEIPVGSEAQVSPSTVAPSAYGYLKGRVKSVAPFPATQQRLLEVLQNESLVKQVSSTGPVTEVLVALQPAHTASGYAWSIGTGPPYAALTGGLPAEVTIVVGTRHPMSYVI